MKRALITLSGFLDPIICKFKTINVSIFQMHKNGYIVLIYDLRRNTPLT